MDELVYLHEHKCLARVIARHAYYSVVKIDGLLNSQELEVLNDDYDYWEAESVEPGD